MSRLSSLVLVLTLPALALACSGRGGDDGATPDASDPRIDAALPGDAAWQDDGTPERRPCTNNLGTGLTTAHGRLDGRLVAIVPPGNGGCNADSSHVHLQVESNGAVYDVAVNVSDGSTEDVGYLAKDLPLPDGPWDEGWHQDQAALLDYPQSGVHSADLPIQTRAQIVSAMQSELADANHVSIFMIGYGVDGGHNVHRVGSGRDGAIFVRPLGGARALLFRFADQSF